MVDERGLHGLDPYDLQDTEAARIESWIGQLDDAALAVPSACDGWSRRDVLAHLVATEEYHHACLAGAVTDFVAGLTQEGATSLDEMNALGVAAHADTPASELLALWKDLNEQSRAGFRAADGSQIDSMIGSYPGRSQAFHVAYELAIHADDIDAPVTEAEVSDRQNWIAGVSQFALTEVKEDVSVERAGDVFIVSRGGVESSFDLAAFLGGVSGRAEDGLLTAADAELLALGY